MMYENVNSNMPNYAQYGGACGLTAALMGIKPESNRIHKLFEYLSENNKEVIKNFDNKSHQYQQSFEFLLYLITIKTEFQNILNFRMKSYFSNGVLPVLKKEFNSYTTPIYKKEVQYNLNDGKINHESLKRRVSVWKKDSELKTLLSLLGMKFLYFSDSKINHIGSVVFEEDDTNEITVKKKRYIYENIKKENIILACDSVHWVTIKDYETDTDELKIHDPGNGSEMNSNINSFGFGRRFYVFEYNKSKINRSVKKILDILTLKN